jgi:hypothetical protein
MARRKLADANPAEGTSFLADAGNLIRELLKAVVDPYRPELHYMRGPGPKWHAKQNLARATVSARLRVPSKTLSQGGAL